MRIQLDPRIKLEREEYPLSHVCDEREEREKGSVNRSERFSPLLIDERLASCSTALVLPANDSFVEQVTLEKANALIDE